jgi:hypothetical protein
VSSRPESRSAVTAPAAPPGRGRAADAGVEARARRGWPADAAVVLLYLACAVAVTWGLWVDPNHRVLLRNQGDQALFEWLLAYAGHTVTHGGNPLFTPLLNAPLGVNLAVNTAFTLPGVLVSPVTRTLGPSVAFTLVLTLNLAATASSWYLLLRRAVVRHRAAAVVGGLFCGFAPGMVTHANAHLNFTAGYLAPWIVWLVLRLGRDRPWRDGTVLGLLVACQYSLGAELLFFTALACAAMVGGYAWGDRERARALAPAYLRALGVTALVAGVLLAYPLWLQFFGPRTYHGTGFDQSVHAEDLLGYLAFPAQSVAGYHGLWWDLAANFTEENSFLGLPLLAMVVVAAVRLRGLRLVRVLTGTAVAALVLSLGPVLKVGGHRTGVPLPWALLAPLPAFNAALPGRVALVLVPIVGTLLALLLDRARPGRARRLAVAAVAVALLPLVPPPLPVTARAPVPRFVASGHWRAYVRPGTSLVPAPLTSDVYPDGQRWQAVADFGFAIPAGFFLGPGGPHGRGRIGPNPPPTMALLRSVARDGRVPTIYQGERDQARRDLAGWNASVVVLADARPGSLWSPHHDELLRTLTLLLGPGRRVDDVWLWQVG